MSLIKHYRHGDVDLHKVNKKEKGEKLPHDGSFVLAEGEATGHNHVISVPRIEDMEIHKTADGGYLMTLRVDGTLTHPEHKTLTIPAGTYKVDREREYDWFSLATRRVID